MIKQLLHKFLASGLAVLVMFSTLSFSVEKHYCGTHLVDVAVSFSSEKTQKDCFGNELINLSKSSCCNDIVEFIEGQELIKNNSFEDFEISNYHFFAAFVCIYNNRFESLPQATISNDDYAPPNLVVDRVINHQVFLI